MRTLQQELDDPSAEDCGRCSNCAGPRFAEPLDPALVEQAQRHLRSRPVEFEVKKMAPDATGRCARSPSTSASSQAGRSRGSATAAGGRRSSAACAAGTFDDEVAPASPTSCVDGAACGPTGSRLCPPSRLDGALGPLAERLAATLGVPYAELIVRREQRPPQREMANAVQQAANVRGAFR